MALLKSFWWIWIVFPLLVNAQQPSNTLNVVADGGAIGDGLVDDTAAINSIITTAQSQGKDVYFPDGTYRITGQIDMKNGVSLFGAESGVSVLKSSSFMIIGEPNNNGSTVADLEVKDLFFLNILMDLSGGQKDNVTIRQCVFATTIAQTASTTQLNLTRGQNMVAEDCIFIASEAPWVNQGIKGIGNYRNVDMIIRRNIFGLDLGNLSWMDTEWKGYANWTNPEARLWQFQANENLPDRMGAMRGAMRLNECNGTLVIDNIFNLDPVACGVEQHAGNMDVDHIIYGTQAYNTEIIANWFRGHPCSPAGGLKFRDTDGPAVIAANYFVDTPLLLYSYENDLVHGLDNLLVYRNHFEIMTDKATFARNGISYSMTDTLAGVNNMIASNLYECADGFSSISLGSGDPGEWKVYGSNRYISGSLIEIEGNLPPYANATGAPPSSATAPYDGYVVPDLNIPEYGEAPVSPPGPDSVTNDFAAIEDTFVKQIDPSSNFGAEAVLNVRQSGTSEMNGYVKFEIADIPGPIYSATLRLYSMHDHQAEVFRVDDVSWAENSMTWSNRPSMGDSIASVAVFADTWMEVDVSDVVTNNGTYAFGLETASGSYRSFSSREGAYDPVLRLNYLGVSADGDMDGDLLPNGWETDYFGNATNGLALFDSDNDGQDNLSEFISGTDPTNGNSYFSIDCVINPSGFVLTWDSVPGREYSVWHGDAMGTNAFVGLTNGLPYPRNSYTDAVHGASSAGFYRVKVVKP